MNCLKAARITYSSVSAYYPESAKGRGQHSPEGRVCSSWGLLFPTERAPRWQRRQGRDGAPPSTHLLPGLTQSPPCFLPPPHELSWLSGNLITRNARPAAFYVGVWASVPYTQLTQARLDKMSNCAFLPLPSSKFLIVVVTWCHVELSCNYLHNLSQNSFDLLDSAFQGHELLVQGRLQISLLYCFLIR